MPGGGWGLATATRRPCICTRPTSCSNRARGRRRTTWRGTRERADGGGHERCDFSASDPGAGVWEATFSIDGKVVQSTVPNENGGRCRDVGQSTDGLPAFLYLQPCPASESVDVPFNTTGSSNGEHHLVVSVLDAAGNSAPVLDREIDVENPVPAQAGAGAAQAGRQAYGDAP